MCLNDSLAGRPCLSVLPDEFLILVFGSRRGRLARLSRRVGAGSTAGLAVPPGWQGRDERVHGGGRARIRANASAMSCAQGQDAAIFRCRRRCPLTIRPAVWRIL